MSAAFCNLFQFLSDPRKVFEDNALLDHHMRLASLVEVCREVSIHGPGVHAAIDLKQSGSHLIAFPRSECPEAAVRVPVFRADSRVENEGPAGWDREDLLLDDGLAPRQDEVRLPRCDELGRLRGVRAVRLEAGRVLRYGWIFLAQEFNLSALELSIPGGVKESVIETKRDDIEKAQQTAASNLATNSLPALTRALPENEDSRQI
jgi:hypothetical protein